MDKNEIETAPDELYYVVVNHEEQYSIWPSGRDFPPGWRAVGENASKSLCLESIETLWTDMRPLSLRQAMDLRVAE